jgi:hypothetical protein
MPKNLHHDTGAHSLGQHKRSSGVPQVVHPNSAQAGGADQPLKVAIVIARRQGRAKAGCKDQAQSSQNSTPAASRSVSCCSRRNFKASTTASGSGTIRRDLAVFGGTRWSLRPGGIAASAAQPERVDQDQHRARQARLIAVLLGLRQGEVLGEAALGALEDLEDTTAPAVSNAMTNVESAGETPGRRRWWRAAEPVRAAAREDLQARPQARSTAAFLNRDRSRSALRSRRVSTRWRGVLRASGAPRLVRGVASNRRG